MRTNIEIDDKLMDYVMATGDFKTKREAVEEGLKLIKRRKAYAALLAARGTLHWDDSEAHWVKVRAEQAAELTAKQALTVADAVADTVELAVHEPAAFYNVTQATMLKPTRKSRTGTAAPKRVTKGATA